MSEKKINSIENLHHYDNLERPATERNPYLHRATDRRQLKADFSAIRRTAIYLPMQQASELQVFDVPARPSCVYVFCLDVTFFT